MCASVGRCPPIPDIEGDPTAEILAIEMAPGDMLVWNSRTFHSAPGNRLDRRRAAFIVRLMPATSFYDHALGAEIGAKHPAQGYGTRPLYLVRGQDRHGGNNFEIGH